MIKSAQCEGCIGIAAMADKKSVTCLYRWEVAETLSKEEEMICKRLTRTGKLFPFLRRQRHRLFNEAFERELCGMYSDMPRGKAPVPPALLAMVMRNVRAESDGAVEEAVFDKRWQMVLGCLGASGRRFRRGAGGLPFPAQRANLDQKLVGGRWS
jgi:hypothetical protein